MKRFSITDKLIIASVALSMITIVIVASYSFTNAKEVILERTFNQLTSVRVIKTNLLDQFFTNCINEVQLAVSSSDIRDLTEQINQIPNPHLDSNSIFSKHQPFINQLLEKYYHRIFIIGENQMMFPVRNIESELQLDMDSKVILSHLDKTNGILITDTEKLQNGMNVIRIYSSIKDTKAKSIGMMMFEISSDAIDSIMLENNPSHGLGISGETYLVGMDSIMRSSSRFQSNSLLQTKVKTSAVEKALSGNKGTAIIQDYRGVKVLSSFSKLNHPPLNWVILSEIDYEEATKEIYGIRNEIIFISIFIFFLVLAVTYVLSRRITIPIQRLNQAALEISSGNLNIDLQTNLEDEIGELTTTFNKMATELKLERAKSLGSLIDGQETERQRLSRELHDSLGQSLIALKLKYESCLNKAEIGAEKKKSFDDLGILFDQTIEETRRISNNLMPAALKEFGLFTAIRQLSNEIADTSDINIHFKTSGTEQILTAKVKTYIFRVSQEAITNILKHSKAKNADLCIDIAIDKVKLTIQDDGIGFHFSRLSTKSSHGINNIKDRVRLLSGEVNIFTSPGKGTNIHIEIPLNN